MSAFAVSGDRFDRAVGWLPTRLPFAAHSRRNTFDPLSAVQYREFAVLE
jgi:hypothetical protein